MSDRLRTTVPEPNLRPLVITCYFLFLVACINGLTALIGVAIAHARRRESVGTIWQSHFENLILVFWVFVSVVVIAILSWPLGLWAAISTMFIMHYPVQPPWPPFLY